ncbi:CBS domain-containing protein [Natronobacterium texcoconense]|uniref:CBS domain-containing protein n=2 Tax=Natronobacterium texcoconense TaxID=1095778 RepID=A0A1H1J268_NATTX|nr:CBS domain-containing protein [Natronobacterium texcoconense]
MGVDPVGDDVRSRSRGRLDSVLGVLDDDTLLGRVLEDVQERSGETVRDVMSTNLVTVSPETEATTALDTLQREGIGRILVTESDGSLAGLISRADLMTILEIDPIRDRPGTFDRRLIRWGCPSGGRTRATRTSTSLKRNWNGI